MNCYFWTSSVIKSTILVLYRLMVYNTTFTGLDINVYPIPVKTDVGQVDLVLRLSDGTSGKNQRFPNVPVRRTNLVNIIYFNRYKILGLLHKRALFDLQFVHNLFWLKLKWNARSTLLLYHLSFSMLWWSSRTLTKLKSQSQKRFNEWKYQYLKYKSKNHSGMDK